MRPFIFRSSRRAVIGVVAAGAITMSAAGAATFHRLSVAQTSGSGGATTFVQNSSSSSALQGEVGSSANTSIHIPFGVLGEYDASSSVFGIGTIGISTSGYGVGGESLGSNPSIIGVAGGTGPAINAAVSASSNGYAFESDAENGSDGADIYTEEDGTGAFIDAGSSDDSGNNGILVFNKSTNNSAIAAINEQASPAPDLTFGGGIYTTATGPGVYAESAGDPPLVGVKNCNNYGDSGGADNGLGGQTCAGLYLVDNGTAGWPLLVYNSSTANYPLYLTADGNLSIAGTLTENGDSVARLPGTDELSYSDKTTENTIEDFGTAQLHGGGADVPLRTDFRATMNAAQPYMVFLTPHGDNRGLYVATSTPQGFSVRESQGGHSTLAFDYRIVARPAGALSARLPRESQLHRSAPPSGSGRTLSFMSPHARAFGRHQAMGKAHNRRLHTPSSLFTAPTR